MTKKTRLIPFDWELYKAGAKAVFINDNYIVVSIFPRDSDECWPYLLIFREKKTLHHEGDLINEKGQRYISNSSWDVFLEIESEEKTFYVNVYSDGRGLEHSTLEEAQEYAKPNTDTFLGTLKITYTDEDLIK